MVTLMFSIGSITKPCLVLSVLKFRYTHLAIYWAYTNKHPAVLDWFNVNIDFVVTQGKSDIRRWL